MVYRLYLVDKKSGKSTGKKRDYVSDEHFKKYGIEKYHAYNSELNCFKEPTGRKAKLCFLNDQNKWEEVDKETLNKLLNNG